MPLVAAPERSARAAVPSSGAANLIYMGKLALEAAPEWPLARPFRVLARPGLFTGSRGALGGVFERGFRGPVFETSRAEHVFASGLCSENQGVTFIVSGRGTLHITILIENMRREGFDFIVGPPKVINKRVNDKLLEPYEIAVVEVPKVHMGYVVELLGKRPGQMTDMQGLGSEETTFLKYKILTRGLLGPRNAILTASRGTTILNTVFESYGPWAGDMSTRDSGSLVAFEEGRTIFIFYTIKFSSLFLSLQNLASMEAFQAFSPPTMVA